MYLVYSVFLIVIASISVSALPHTPTKSEILGFYPNNLCGGVAADVGAISGSIDYWFSKDEAGQPEKTCVWLIVPSSLHERLAVKITDLKLPKNNQNCKKSRISINTFTHNETQVESHVLCETTEDYIQVRGNAVAIILTTKKSVKGHGFKLEWERSGEYLGIQKVVKGYTSWNKEDNLDWPGYFLDTNMHGRMSLYAFPKGNQSEAHHVMQAVFKHITFDKPSEICTDELMLITAIENGVLRLLDTICNTRPSGLTYESHGGFVFFVSMNAKWGTLYTSQFQFSYQTIAT